MLWYQGLHEMLKCSILSRVMTDKSIQLVKLDAGDPPGDTRKTLFGLDLQALAARMVGAGEPAWRGKQLAEALYRQRVGGLDGITTLPKPLRQRLTDEGWEVLHLDRLGLRLKFATAVAGAAAIGGLSRVLIAYLGARSDPRA